MVKKPTAGYRQSRKGMKWEAKGVGPTGQRKSFYGSTPQEASDRAFASFPQDIDPNTLYGFYASAYLPTIIHRSPAWKSMVGWAMDTYIIPTFGDKPLRDLNRSELQAFFNKIELKPSSTGKVRTILSCVLKLAVDDELLLRNPAASIRLPSAEKPNKRALSVDELGTLIDSSPPTVRPLVILAGVCGLRLGEALGLTWSAIDKTGLHVRQQVRKAKGGPVVLLSLKTRESNRIIPIPDEVKVMLRCGQASDVWVCSDQLGGYMSPDAINKELAKACTLAGVPRVTPHELRHTFVSLMENEIEAPRSVVGEIVGHASEGITGLYSHARMEQKRKWLRKLVECLSTERRQSPVVFLSK